MAKVSCILRHWGVQLSWAMPAILVAGKGGGDVFISCVSLLPFLFSFFPVPIICSTISSVSFLPFSGRRHKMTHKG